MSISAISTLSPQLAAAAAVHVQQQTQAGTDAVRAAVSHDPGGGAAPIISSSVQAPGSLEIFA